MKLLDENSRLITDIRDDSSKIPYIARMKLLLATSAETEECGKCYVKMAIWHRDFGTRTLDTLRRWKSKNWSKI